MVPQLQLFFNKGGCQPLTSWMGAHGWCNSSCSCCNCQWLLHIDGNQPNSVSAHDMWIQPKDRFSTVTKARIFQMKSELQNIKKGSEPVSHYLQKIKDARDHLSAIGVSFEDDDIVILALNGLPSDYNTFRCMIRGRDNTLSLKDFRSQLLAEEATLEHTQSASPFISAMLAQNQTFQGKALVLDEGSSPSHSHIQSQGYSSNSKPSHLLTFHLDLVGVLMVIMAISMVPQVVLMVLMPCSPTVATLTIEALILKDVEEVVAIINLVHALIKFLLLVLVFFILVLTFSSVKSVARKAM